MTELVLERDFEPAITPDDVRNMSAEFADCFDMHQVEWHASHLSLDGRKMVCRFTAPDMESTRIALRKTKSDDRRLWSGDVFDAPGAEEEDVAAANVLVERSFEEPVTLEEIQNIEDAGIDCLESRNVRFIRTYFSRDRKRMICLYEAPDAESVRQSQREAGVPFNDAWAFRTIGPRAAGS